MNIKVTNNKAPLDHKLRNVIIGVDHPVLVNVILTATGGGMNEQATAKAMETHRRLRELAVGESITLKADYLNLALRQIQVDATFTRVED